MSRIIRKAVEEVITSHCDGTYFGLKPSSTIDFELNPVALVDEITKAITKAIRPRRRRPKNYVDDPIYTETFLGLQAVIQKRVDELEKQGFYMEGITSFPAPELEGYVAILMYYELVDE